MTTYIHYNERPPHDQQPLIEYWTPEQYTAHHAGRAYGFGDALITGGDIVCLAEMHQHRDYRAHIKKIEHRVTIWMAQQAEIAKSPPKPKKRGKRAKAD